MMMKSARSLRTMAVRTPRLLSFCLLWACGVCLLGASALRADDVESRHENDWLALKAHIDAVHALTSYGWPTHQTALGREKAFAIELMSRLFRKVGADYFAKYPDDPRIMAWVEELPGSLPLYYSLDWMWTQIPTGKSPVSPKGTPEMQREIAENGEAQARVEAACLAMPAISDQRKMRMLAFHTVSKLLTGESTRSNSEWKVIAEELVALGDRFPEVDVSGEEFTFVYAIKWLVEASRKGTDAETAGVEVRQTLAACKNGSIRDLADRADARARMVASPVDFKLTTLEGPTVDFAQFRGKGVLLVFTGIGWCSACKDQEPLVRALYEKYHAAGLDVVMLHLDPNVQKNQARVKALIKEAAFPWPVFILPEGFKSDISIRFGVTGVPMYFLLDRQGRLVSPERYRIDSPLLDADLRRVLGVSPTQTARASSP